MGEISFCAYNTGIGWRKIIENMYKTATVAEWNKEHGKHAVYAGGHDVPLTHFDHSLVLNPVDVERVRVKGDEPQTAAEEERLARQKAREAQKMKQMMDELTFGKNLGSSEKTDLVKIELANRLFFRLYQCANMLHKTGSRAVEAEGLTTQQWAVLGALSRPEAKGGMSVGDLARYLMVTKVRGHFSEFSGAIQVAERAEDSAAELVIGTRADKRANSLRKPFGAQYRT